MPYHLATPQQKLMILPIFLHERRQGPIHAKSSILCAKASCNGERFTPRATHARIPDGHFATIAAARSASIGKKTAPPDPLSRGAPYAASQSSACATAEYRALTIGSNAFRVFVPETKPAIVIGDVSRVNSLA